LKSICVHKPHQHNVMAQQLVLTTV